MWFLQALFLLLFSFPAISVAGCTQLDPPQCTVKNSVYGFFPNLGANAFFTVAFAILAIVQVVELYRWKTWSFGIVVTIGCLLEMIGTLDISRLNLSCCSRALLNTDTWFLFNRLHWQMSDASQPLWRPIRHPNQSHHCGSLFPFSGALPHLEACCHLSRSEEVPPQAATLYLDIC